MAEGWQWRERSLVMVGENVMVGEKVMVGKKGMEEECVHLVEMFGQFCCKGHREALSCRSPIFY